MWEVKRMDKMDLEQICYFLYMQQMEEQQRREQEGEGQGDDAKEDE